MDKIQVVIADDSEVYRFGLKEILERELIRGKIYTCDVECDLIEVLKRYHPDILLIDIEHHVDDCTKILEYINKELPQTKKIILTHLEKYHEFIAILRLGIQAYLSKNIKIQSLIKCIDLVAEGEFILSPPEAISLIRFFYQGGHRRDLSDIKGSLSSRERSVISLVAKGLTNKEIAEKLYVSENTTKVHVRNIMEKLHAHTRQEAVSLITE